MKRFWMSGLTLLCASGLMGCLSLLGGGTPQARVVPEWSEFTPISLQELENAKQGYYVVTLDSSALKDRNLFYWGDLSVELIRQEYGPQDEMLDEFRNWRERTIRSESANLYVFKAGDAGFGWRVGTLLHVDGIISTEEMAAKQQQEQAERKANAEAEEKANAERNKARIAKAKSLAKGYTYHDIDEDAKSGRLFDSGALENGHAYYISGFMVGGGGVTGGVITSLFGNPNYHVVDYVSQKVKGEVAAASQTMFGLQPITVVVAGGKPPLNIPLILGLVE